MLFSKVLFKIEIGQYKLGYCSTSPSRNVEGPRSTYNVFKGCFNHKRLPPWRLLIPWALLKPHQRKWWGAPPLQAGILKTSQG